MSCGEIWSKICHVETFLHMINVETIFFVTIHADLSQNLLCCHLRCIGAKSILWYGTVRNGTERYGMVRNGMEWYGTDGNIVCAALWMFDILLFQRQRGIPGCQKLRQFDYCIVINVFTCCV